jgi:hypothetical protein
MYVKQSLVLLDPLAPLEDKEDKGTKIRGREVPPKQMLAS